MENNIEHQNIQKNKSFGNVCSFGKSDFNFSNDAQILKKLCAFLPGITLYSDFENPCTIIENTVSEIYSKNVISDFLESNRDMLSDRKGMIKFMNSLVDNYAGYYIARKQVWKLKLFTEITKKYSEIFGDRIRKHFRIEISAWFDIFKIISGKDDFNESHIWYDVLLFPFCSPFFSVGPLAQIEKNFNLSLDYDTKLKCFVKERMLKEFGLIYASEEAKIFLQGQILQNLFPNDDLYR